MGIPGMKLIEPVENNSDETAKEFEASALPCAETMSALAFMLFAETC